MINPYRRRRYGALMNFAKRATFAAGMGTLRPSPTAKQIARQVYKSATRKGQTQNKAPAQPLKGKRVDKRKTKKVHKSKQSKKIEDCCAAIKELRTSEKASLGTMTFRNRVVITRLLCNVNEQAALDVNPIATTNIEAVLAQCKYFDPSNPSTLLTASQVAGTYQRNTLIKGIWSNVFLRNNYQSDVKCTVYLCRVKDDTSNSPLTAWTAGIPDGSNLSAVTDLTQYPTDYNVFNDLWKAKIIGKQTLSPGQSMECKYSTPQFEYDSSTVDSHNLTYQHEYKSSSVLVVVEGTVSHDTALDQQGLCAAGVDISYSNTYKVVYNAGINLSYTYVSNSLDTPTNGFVQSHQPMSDNQAYSVS